MLYNLVKTKKCYNAYHVILKVDVCVNLLGYITYSKCVVSFFFVDLYLYQKIAPSKFHDYSYVYTSSHLQVI